MGIPAGGQTISVLDEDGQVVVAKQTTADGLLEFELDTPKTSVAFRADFLESAPIVSAFAREAGLDLDFGSVQFGASTPGVALLLRAPAGSQLPPVKCGVRSIEGARLSSRGPALKVAESRDKMLAFIEHSYPGPYVAYTSMAGYYQETLPQPALGNSWQVQEFDLSGLCSERMELAGLPDVARAGRTIELRRRGSGDVDQINSVPPEQAITDENGQLTVIISNSNGSTTSAFLKLADDGFAELADELGSTTLRCSSKRLSPRLGIAALALVRNGSLLLDQEFSCRTGQTPGIVASTLDSRGIILVPAQFVSGSKVIEIAASGLGQWSVQTSDLIVATDGVLGIPVSMPSELARITVRCTVSPGAESNLPSVRLRGSKGILISQVDALATGGCYEWAFKDLQPGSYDLYWSWAKSEAAQRPLILGLELGPSEQAVHDARPPVVLEFQGVFVDWNTLSSELRPLRVSLEGCSAPISDDGRFNIKAAIPVADRADAYFGKRVQAVRGAVALGAATGTGSLSARVLVDELLVVSSNLDMGFSADQVGVEYWTLPGDAPASVDSGRGFRANLDENALFRMLISRDESVVGVVFERNNGSMGVPLAFFGLNAESPQLQKISGAGRWAAVSSEGELDVAEALVVGEPFPGIQVTCRGAIEGSGRELQLWLPGGTTKARIRAAQGQVIDVRVTGDSPIKF